MEKSLGNYKSIYFVNIVNTKIDVGHPVMGAVHVTDCQHVSFMQSLQTQQLRLHNSRHIHCYDATINAGTILEDCKNIVFYHVPSSTDVRNSIKDFNWLHNGIVSPNYSIQIYDPTTTTTMMTNNYSPNEPFLDSQSTNHPIVELLNQPSNNLMNDDDNSDDDEI